MLGTIYRALTPSSSAASLLWAKSLRRNTTENWGSAGYTPAKALKARSVQEKTLESSPAHTSRVIFAEPRPQPLLHNLQVSPFACSKVRCPCTLS